MKVKTKLIISFTVIVALLWLIALYAVNNFGNLDKQFAVIEEEILPGTSALNEAEKYANDAFAEAINYVISNDAAMKEAALLNLEHLKEIEIRYYRYEMEQDRLEAAQRVEGIITDFSLFIVALMDSETQEISAWPPLVNNTSDIPPIHTLQQEIDKIRTQYDEKLEEVKTDFNNVYNSSVHSLLLSAGLIALITIAAAIITTRSIVRPLLALRQGTKEIAQGNLKYKVGTDAGDEIGELSRDFDQMTASLNTSMTSIDNLNREILERKRAEEKQQAILATAIDGFWISSLEGKFLEVNDSYCRMTGYTREELLEMYVWDVEAKENQGEAAGRIKAILGRGSARFETKHRRKDGKIIDIEISVNHWNTGAEGQMFVFVRDITERKRAEEEIKESEEKFSVAFLSSPNTMAITTVKDGKFIEVNNSHTTVTGYTLEETLGHTAIELGLWAKAEDRQRMLKIMKEQGRVFNEEFDFRMKSGEIRNWLFSAEKIDIGEEPCLISITTDITELKRTEEALRESEEKFYKAFSASPDVIAIVSMNDNRFVEVNENFIRYNGYPREEVIGHTASELGIWVNIEERNRIMKILKEEGSVRNEEFQMRTKSGEIRTGLFSAEIINFGGEPCSIVITTDITERKRAEKLQKDENYVLTLMGQGAEINVLLDAIVLLGESHNPAIKGSALLYDSSKELLFPAASPSLPENYIKLMENGIPVGPNLGTCGTAAYSRERVIEPDVKNGTIFPQVVAEQVIANGLFACWSQPIIASNGDLLGTIANYSEKTGEPSPGDLRVLEWSTHIAAVAIERRESEEALRFSDAAFKSIHEGVIAVDTEETITHWNEICEQIFGIKSSEAIGRKFTDVIEVVESNVGGFDDALKSLKTDGYIQDEQLYRTPNGEIWVDVHMQEIRGNGEFYGRVVLATDITQRKRAEAELKRALLELKQSSAKLTATNKELETFSYSVSHDLRSPLRSIDGFSQALLEDYNEKLDDNGQDYLKRLRVASQKMGELIDGLLKLSRLTRSEMHEEPVDLSSLAEEVSTRLQETQPKRRTKFVIDKGLTANGDPQLLRVLIENLFGNAWKFTGKKQQAKIEFGSSKNNGKRTYFVRDNGAGFDMTYADKLFGAFQRLHDGTEFPGTGIGLATVQRIINRHGGTIRAEGAEGKGATFYFTLA